MEVNVGASPNYCTDKYACTIPHSIAEWICHIFHTFCDIGWLLSLYVWEITWTLATSFLSQNWSSSSDARGLMSCSNEGIFDKNGVVLRAGVNEWGQRDTPARMCSLAVWLLRAAPDAHGVTTVFHPPHGIGGLNSLAVLLLAAELVSERITIRVNRWVDGCDLRLGENHSLYDEPRIRRACLHSICVYYASTVVWYVNTPSGNYRLGEHTTGLEQRR